MSGRAKQHGSRRDAARVGRGCQRLRRGAGAAHCSTRSRSRPALMFMAPFFWTVVQLAQDRDRDLRLPADLAAGRAAVGQLRRGLAARAVRPLDPQHARSSPSLSVGRRRCSRSSLVAYSFARFRYPGRDLFFIVTLEHDDAAGRGHADPAVPALQPARLARHVPAADRAVLVRRRRLQHLPAAPVLHDDPARPRRGGPDRRRRAPCGSSGASCCRCPGRRWRRWRSSPSSPTGTTSSGR